MIKDDTAGILLVRWHKAETWITGRKLKAHWAIHEERKPIDRKADKLTEKQYLKMLELCAMRMWTMKKREIKKKEKK